MLFRSLARFTTNLAVPTPPPGTGIVLHGQLQKVKVMLKHSDFLVLYSSMFLGGILGNKFYTKLVMKTNPANPPRWAEEKAPERHLHAPEDE